MATILALMLSSGDTRLGVFNDEAAGLEHIR